MKKYKATEDLEFTRGEETIKVLAGEEVELSEEEAASLEGKVEAVEATAE